MPENHPRLTFEKEGYSYEIVRDGQRSVYTVRKGSETFTVPLVWGFGQGKTAGQTYLFEWNGAWYDTRVSFFPAIQGLDITMGFDSVRPRTVTTVPGTLPGRRWTSWDASAPRRCRISAAAATAMQREWRRTARAARRR